MKELERIRPAKTWRDVEAAIKIAIELGIFVDKRGEMPRGRDAKGNLVEWKRNRATPEDVLGHCVHQNGSQNFTKPKATGRYHTSKNNHITPGRPMASSVYPIMIPDLPGPAWLAGNLDWITYGQGDNDAGDENRHLLTVLVMGGFEDSGYKRSYTKKAPSDHQMENLSMVVAWLQRVFDYGGEGFFGHYHFGKGSCPGRHLRHWTEAAREADDKADLLTDREWQEALLRWNPRILPIYGADDDWGGESKHAVAVFQRQHQIRQTGVQDPFAELILLQRYPAPAAVVIDTSKLEPITGVGGKPVVMKYRTPGEVVADDIEREVVEGSISEEEARLRIVEASSIPPYRDVDMIAEEFGHTSVAVEQIDDPEDPPLDDDD